MSTGQKTFDQNKKLDLASDLHPYQSILQNKARQFFQNFHCLLYWIPIYTYKVVEKYITLDSDKKSTCSISTSARQLHLRQLKKRNRCFFDVFICLNCWLRPFIQDYNLLVFSGYRGCRWGFQGQNSLLVIFAMYFSPGYLVFKISLSTRKSCWELTQRSWDIHALFQKNKYGNLVKK